MCFVLQVERGKPVTKLEIVYLGEDLLFEGGVFARYQRKALPTNCMLNGMPLHDFRGIDQRTGPRRFQLPKDTYLLHLEWDVKDRNLVNPFCVPLPVCDVRLLP